MKKGAPVIQIRSEQDQSSQPANDQVSAGIPMEDDVSWKKDSSMGGWEMLLKSIVVLED